MTKAETDYHVGPLLDFLEKSGLDENTRIVFSSDNGPEKSWRERIPDFNHTSSGPFRGGKRDIFEGGHRVPFLVRWPARIKPPGRTWNGLIGQTDLMATFAEILGVELPEDAGEDSQSFARVLLDPASKHQRPPLVNHAAIGRFAVTLGHGKLVLPHRRWIAELFDLASDPGETKDVAKDHLETDTQSRSLTMPRSVLKPRRSRSGEWGTGQNASSVTSSAQAYPLQKRRHRTPCCCCPRDIARAAKLQVRNWKRQKFAFGALQTVAQRVIELTNAFPFRSRLRVMRGVGHTWGHVLIYNLSEPLSYKSRHDPNSDHQYVVVSVPVISLVIRSLSSYR